MVSKNIVFYEVLRLLMKVEEPPCSCSEKGGERAAHCLFMLDDLEIRACKACFSVVFVGGQAAAHAPVT